MDKRDNLTIDVIGVENPSGAVRTQHDACRGRIEITRSKKSTRDSFRHGDAIVILIDTEKKHCVLSASRPHLSRIRCHRCDSYEIGNAAAEHFEIILSKCIAAVKDVRPAENHRRSCSDRIELFHDKVSRSLPD